MLSFSADQRFFWFDRQVRGFFAYSRIRRFISELHVPSGAHIIDLGGRPEHWHRMPMSLRVDILNTKEEIQQFHQHKYHNIQIIEGDVTKPIQSIHQYDFIYCNSVLEHVGGKAARSLMAANILAADKPYWVQVPSQKFPIEHHCRELFWWRMGDAKKKKKIEQWKRTWPFMAAQMESTNAVRRDELAQLFPCAVIRREFVLGFEKSLIAARVR